MTGEHADVGVAQLDARRPTTSASPATTSTSTARAAATTTGDVLHVQRTHVLERLPTRASRRSTAPGTSRRALVSRHRPSPCDTPPGSWPRTRSTTARAAWPATPPATATPARSPARHGRRAATAARSRSTASTTTSTSARSAPSTTPASRSRHGCRRDHHEEGRRRSSAPGPAAARCSGSTTSRPTTTSRSAAASPRYLDSGPDPIAGQWQHVAATFDGTTARYYIDGAEVASRTVSGSVGSSNTWRIGAYGAHPGGFFDGLIDDVRIYNRALTASEIQFDMNQPVHVANPETRRRRRARDAHGDRRTVHQATLAWGAATDDVGVAALQRPPLDDRGLHTRRRQPDRAADRDELHRHRASRRHLLLQGHRRGRRRQRRPGLEPGERHGRPRDTTPPTVSITAPAAGATVQRHRSTFSANATDNVAVAGVQFRVDGANLGAEDTRAPYSVAWDTRGELERHPRADRGRPRRGGNTRRRPGDRDRAQHRRLDRRPRGRVRLDETRGTTRCRLVRQPPRRHAPSARRGQRALRQRARRSTATTTDRPAGARHVLQDGVHARGVGAQAVGEEGRRRGRRWDAASGGPMIWVDHVERPLQAHARQRPRAPTSTPAGRRPSASGSTSRRRTTAARRASTSTASRSRARRSPATSATRTPGGSARTAARRRLLRRPRSTTSASTTAR